MTTDDEQVPITVTVVEMVDGVEVPIGEPRERTTSRGALRLLHGPDWQAEPGPGLPSSVLDRRQSACEAFWDSFGGPALSGTNTMTGSALGAAVETATRVRITHEVVMAFVETPDTDDDDITAPLRAAFRAAGFEVEE